MMVWQSVDRLIHPVTIVFDQAIMVAMVGLVVNGASVIILDQGNHRHVNPTRQTHQPDYNLRAAYLHVMADALTSILAIIALLLGKYVGLLWMDPLMGIVGAILVTHWSIALIRTTTAVLLDKQSPETIASEVTQCIERDAENRLADLHIWSIGTDIYAAILSVVTHDPKPPGYYRNLIPGRLGLQHVSVEVNQCHEV